MAFRSMPIYTSDLVNESRAKNSIVYAEYSDVLIAYIRGRHDYVNDTGMMAQDGHDGVTGLLEVWGDGWRIHLEVRRPK